MGKTSLVWEHFMQVGEKKVKCKHCDKELVYLGGTSNLRDHVGAKHPEKEIGLASPKSPKITTLLRRGVCGKERSTTITTLLAKFIAKDTRPINLIQVCEKKYLIVI
jgi:hypothetical protein